MMGRSRYRFGEANRPHFMTCTVVGWLPIFTRPESVNIVLESWNSFTITIACRFWDMLSWKTLHLIGVSDDLPKEIGNFKSYTARRIIDLLVESKAETIMRQLRHEKIAHKSDRDYQLWQEGSQPKEIQNDQMMRQKLEYIHYNPVKRGYVDLPEYWRYSIARNYMGQPGLVQVMTDWA